jgi:LAO/AO transport system kinase
LVSAIEANLSLSSFPGGTWRPPIVRTVATSGRGVPDLLTAIDDFLAQAPDVRTARRRERAVSRLREMVSSQLMRQVDRSVSAEEWAVLVDRIVARTADPYMVAHDLVARVTGGDVASRPVRADRAGQDDGSRMARRS